MKKTIVVLLSVLAVLTFTASAVFAAPWTPVGNQTTPNDRFVAYYETGRHAIAGFTNDQYYGRDLVMQRNSTGQFHQWFEGTDPDGNFIAIHSVWNITKSGECPESWVKIENAYPQWGYYMTPGETYCVHNNYYLGTK